MDDHDHHDDHDRHDDRDHERREQQEQMVRALANAAAVAAAMNRPPPLVYPIAVDQPGYREQFEHHDDNQISVLQFATHMLEQRVASLEALVTIQGSILKSTQAQVDAMQAVMKAV